MSSTTGTVTSRVMTREALVPWLGTLKEWLLPDQFYDLAQTWPQLYRSDGHGVFHGILDGERLVSHAALRPVEIQGNRSRLRTGLVGSVATDPMHRGRGLAGHILQAVIDDARASGLDLLLLWAKRPGLYAHAGFRERGEQLVLTLQRMAPHGHGTVRPALFEDWSDLLALHEAKPLRVVRDRKEMQLLLSVPGLNTVVLERGGRAIAYACLGKGADFQGWWHEVGGSDEDLAELLPAAMNLLDIDVAMALLPPYRRSLAYRLGDAALDCSVQPFAMALPLSERGDQDLFVDGLDSV